MPWIESTVFAAVFNSVYSLSFSAISLSAADCFASLAIRIAGNTWGPLMHTSPVWCHMEAAVMVPAAASFLMRSSSVLARATCSATGTCPANTSFKPACWSRLQFAACRACKLSSFLASGWLPPGVARTFGLFAFLRLNRATCALAALLEVSPLERCAIQLDRFFGGLPVVLILQL
jgi:hypothetical protein